MKMGFFEDYLPPYQKTVNIALASIMAALVCVTTILLVIPIPGTTGYFNVGEAVIYISAILFGPLIGGFAGGVGAALADVIYAIDYAPATLIIKFCEGFIVGYITYKIRTMEMKERKELLIIIGAIALGGLIMIIGYWIYESFILPVGIIIATAAIPWNVVQVLFGMVVGVPASIGIQKAYPIQEIPQKED